MSKFGVGEYVLFTLTVCYVLLRYFHFYVFLAAAAVALGAACLYEWKRLHYFKEQGVPGPEPLPIYGNAQLFFQNEDMECDMQWPEKYGPIFGFFGLGFLGKGLVVSDTDVLRRVLIKDFMNFSDRAEVEAFEAFTDESRIMSKFLSISTGQRWKDRRRTITPAFTTGRIKLMSYFVVRCAKILDGILQEHVEGAKPIDIKNVCNNFTLDVIAQAALAQDINVQRQDNPLFRKYCQEMMEMTMKDPILIFQMVFPKTYSFIEKAFGVKLMFSKGEEFFRQALGAIIERRRGDTANKPVDFLQLELDAMDEEHGDKVDEIDAEIDQVQGGRKVQLSKDEIIADCLLFLAAGYETSSSTIQFILYLLACNQHVQEKCQKEVDAVLDNEELSYASVTKMHYIDAAMHETLRLYPIAPRLMRVTKEDIEYDGVTFHKGDAVVIPVWYLHHNENYYPDPYKFEPERFLPENRSSIDPMTYMPFGAGPRNCIGMRFAQMEVRMTMAYIIKRFKFDLAPGTPKPSELKFDTANLLRVKGSPIMLSISRR